MATKLVDRHKRLRKRDRQGCTAGTVARLTEGAQWEWPLAVSPDGRWLLFNLFGGETLEDLWRLPLDGEGAPEPLLQSRFSEAEAALSPDGRWLVYTSDESRRSEVYVRSFPSLGGKQQVSTEGGKVPRWSRDGRELFFRDGRGG